MAKTKRQPIAQFAVSGSDWAQEFSVPKEVLKFMKSRGLTMVGDVAFEIESDVRSYVSDVVSALVSAGYPVSLRRERGTDTIKQVSVYEQRRLTKRDLFEDDDDIYPSYNKPRLEKNGSLYLPDLSDVYAIEAGAVLKMARTAVAAHKRSRAVQMKVDYFDGYDEHTYNARINKNGDVFVGCQTVAWPEVAVIATKLGLDVPTD